MVNATLISTLGNCAIPVLSDLVRLCLLKRFSRSRSLLFLEELFLFTLGKQQLFSFYGHFFRISVRLGEYDTEKDPDCVEVFRGRQDCAPPPVNVPIEELIPHEQYNPNDRNQYHDIALLRLKLDVEYTGNRLNILFIYLFISLAIMVWFVNDAQFCMSETSLMMNTYWSGSQTKSCL